MKRYNIKQAIIPIIFGIAFTVMFTFTSANLYSQCCNMKGHEAHSGHSSQTKLEKSSVDSTLIRTGKIDVYDIDSNMDGYVYQDPMHWNVISDKPGKCPICGMELEKVKIKEAIKNLKDHDFEVK